MKKRNFLKLLCALPAGTAIPAHSWAQRKGNESRDYPARPVRIILPYSAGSATDTILRILTPLLSEQLKQPFVVENIGGAGGTTGSIRAARATPDGYTLLAASASLVITNPILVEKLPYNGMRDFVPITTVGDSPIVVAVRKNLPVNTLAELVAAAKAKPGGLTYGSGGNGSISHIAGEIFKWKTGTDLLHVPYKGVAPAVPDIVGGRLDALFVSYPSVRTMAEAGNIKVLAVAAAKRSNLVPGIPTAAEAGVKDYVMSAWNGLMAPTGTPNAILAKLNRVVTELLRSPELMARLAPLGMEPIPCSREEFSARLKEEFATMSRVIKVARIKAE